MSRLAFFSLPLVLALAVVRADEPPKQAEPWSTPDVQDVIYLGEQRPVLFRLHVHIDGKPIGERWNDCMTRLFKYLDRDDNGTLDKSEVERMPSVQQIAFLPQNGFQPGVYYGAPPFMEVDADRDGKVTFEEFTRYYQNNGLTPTRLVALPGTANTTVLTDLLFALLDTNKDGKLSKAELDAADKVLRKFDQDDDELITTFELQNSGVNVTVAAPPVPVVGIGQRPGIPVAAQAPFLLLHRDDADNRLANRLKAAKDVIAHYDRNKDGKLSRQELGFSPELFARLNPNADGLVDTTRLLRWLLVLPDVELTFRLGKNDGAMPVEILENRRKDVPALPVRKAALSTVAMTFGKTNLNLVLVENPNANLAAGYTQAYLQQFRQVDRDKKGFVTAKQLDNPQFAILKQLMKVADRNGDDKLTEQEVTEYAEVMLGASDAVTTLQFSDLGQGLFEILDANRDGRLSVRELRTAWARLAQHDDDGDGCISKTELPRQCQLTVTRGNQNNLVRVNPVFVQSGMQQPGIVAPAAGPLWFRKMDVNNDGDVSQREFLGSPEDFARIDTDGDGLISLEEAIKADAWFRAKVKKQ